MGMLSVLTLSGDFDGRGQPFLMGSLSAEMQLLCLIVLCLRSHYK